ncbi:MAG: DNA polymerase I [Pseudomonadota bacterium]
MAQTLYLIDGSNHAFRMFHAMPRLTAGGQHTGALMGFANLLRWLDREAKPDFAAVVFDRGKSFRVDLFPAYKANRAAMPEELREQWPRFPELVEAWGYPCIAPEGFEADDVIGTLATRHAGPELEVWIVSGDKDFTQLVGEHVRILDLKGGDPKVTDSAGVTERFGVGPERVVDILALWGDSSDNVPGVPGIGEKKASALLQAHGSLERVLEAAPTIKGKMGQSLVEFADQARLSRRLVTIVRDMPLALGLDDLARRPRDRERLHEILLRYQFKTHLEDLAAEGPTPAAGEGIDRDRYRTVRTEAALEAAVAACRRAGRFAFDTETTSLDPLQARLVGLSLCWSADDAVYIPVGHARGEQLPLERVMAVLGPLLADPTVGKTGQNLKYDLEVLLAQGYALEGIDGDTMLADYLLETGRTSRKLDDIAMRVLGHRMIAYSEVTAGLQEGEGFEAVDIAAATAYAAEDAHVAWLLDRALGERLRAEGLDGLYREVELPVIPVLAHMELAGIKLDRDALAAVGRDFGEAIASLEADIHRLAGHAFNIASPKQLAEVLFDERGYQVQKKTKTGRSTDATTLEAIAAANPGDPLPQALLDYRGLTKLQGTYVDALPAAVSPVDGRVHTSFHQAVAATGRLASMDPNLQNIPIRSPEGRRIRACFVPKEGHVFLSADYSQIELRVLADYCGSGTLVEAFQRGEDIHRRTAAEVFGVMPGLVTPEQRRAAKAVNFGIIYGMSAFRLANELGIPRGRAQRIIDDYFKLYPQVAAYVEQAVAAAREQGVATTRYGRKRVVPDLGATIRHVREAAERVAVNTPIQGTAADIVKLAMARVWARLEREHPAARLLLQVHDELLVEVPEPELEPVRAAVVEEMVRAAALCVPLVVGTGVARTWDEAH